MVPGPGTIFSLLPKVQLALKMKRSPLLEYWFYKKKIFKVDIITSLNNNKRNVGAYPAVNDFFEMYEILLDRKYTNKEIRKGIDFAADFSSYIQNKRERQKINDSTAQNRRRAIKFLENKISPKLYQVYAKREVPKFSIKTRGEIRYIEEIITEAKMPEYINGHSNYHISAFKFKDKNGRVSLNFYGYSPERRHRR